MGTGVRRRFWGRGVGHRGCRSSTVLRRGTAQIAGADRGDRARGFQFGPGHGRTAQRLEPSAGVPSETLAFRAGSLCCCGRVRVRMGCFCGLRWVSDDTGAGTRLLAGLPLYACGHLLRGINAARMMAGLTGDGALASLGAAAGVLVTGLGALTRVGVPSFVLFLIVILSGTARLQGWVLRPEALNTSGPETQ